MHKIKIISRSAKYSGIITSRGLNFGKSLKELYVYKQLLWSFVIRDYKVRYAQTFIGYWWSLIQPIASVSVLFLVFQKIVPVPTNNIPYLLFALSGLVLWNYFNFVITQSAASLVSAQAMIRKIYFPRLALPLSRALVGLVEPLVGLVLLSGLLIYYGLFNPAVLFFPVAILCTALAALGIGLWTSALSIKYRDLQQILPFLLQLLFFLTPVAYSTQLLDTLIPKDWYFLIYLNPMTGIIESFRSALFGTPFNNAGMISYVVAIIFFGSGLRYFQKVEMKIADIV